MNHIIIRTDITTALTTFRKDSPEPLGDDSGYDDLFAQIVSGNANVQFYLETICANFPALSESEIITRFSRQLFRRLLSDARARNYNLQEYFNLTDANKKFADGERAHDIELAIQRELRAQATFNEDYQAIVNAETVTADPNPRKYETARYIIEAIVQFTSNTISLIRNSSPDDVSTNTANTTHHMTSVEPSMSSLTYGLQITGLILTAINFIFIPAYYLFCKIQGREVPFNFHNNLKWAYSTVSLTLGLISFFVPPVGLSILIAYSAAVGVYSLLAFGKYIYDRIQLPKNIDENQAAIEILEERIQLDIYKAERIRMAFDHESQKEYPDPDKLNHLSQLMESLKEQRQKHCDELKNARNTEVFLQSEVYKSKSIMRPAINITYLLLTASFITGVILLFNPFTAPIGGIILTVGAILTIGNHILNKLHQAWERPRVNKILSCTNENEDIELSQLKISTSLKQNHRTQIAKLPVLPAPQSRFSKFAVPGSKLKNPFFAQPESQPHSIHLQDQLPPQLMMRA